MTAEPHELLDESRNISVEVPLPVKGAVANFSVYSDPGTEDSTPSCRILSGYVSIRRGPFDYSKTLRFDHDNIAAHYDDSGELAMVESMALLRPMDARQAIAFDDSEFHAALQWLMLTWGFLSAHIDAYMSEWRQGLHSKQVESLEVTHKNLMIFADHVKVAIASMQPA